MFITTTTRLAIVFRVLIALCTRTVFQPDEYFQSLEPAYHLVFGHGLLTWEWLAPHPIRSILYPALNVPIYALLKVSGIADWGALGDWLLIACPRILHGLFAAATDVWLCELSRVVLGSAYVSTTLFVSLSSFFHALSLSRSLSNSLETSLSTIAFAYYPWDASQNTSPHVSYNRPRLRMALIFSALACMVRPTNAIIWTFLYGKLLWSLRTHTRIVSKIIAEMLMVGIVALASLFILDSVYYSKPTFTPFNFLATNLTSVSLFYGSNSWHYYFSQALPIICSTALPFTLHGMWTALFGQRKTALRTMLGAILWSIIVYSFAGHKEWRFIHPLLPLLHIFAAKSLIDLSPTLSNSKSKGKRLPANSWWEEILRPAIPPIPRRYTAFLLITFPASLYVVLFYCSAPITVLSYIRSLPKEELRQGAVGFLMPCHSTPGHAYVHRPELANGSMWALGCEPPIGIKELANYHDQTDVFFTSPISYLSTYFPENVDPAFPDSPYPASIPGQPSPSADTMSGKYPWKHEWPRYLVFFGDLLREEGVKPLLEVKGYQQVWQRGHIWEGEGKRTGGVRVWKWIPK